MNPVIEKLLGVQALDVKILRLKAKLAAGPARLAHEEAGLASHRARHDDAARRAKEAYRSAERKNGELDALDKKMKDLDAKLNGARTNKEYDALKHEIAGNRADYGILEEEALQQWEVSEVRHEEAEREFGKIKGLEADLAERAREWNAEAADLNAELKELLALRATRAADISGTWLQIYDRVLEIRGSPAVVEVSEQYCQGCQMSVTINDVTRALGGHEVVQCKACNRILYAKTF